MKWQDFQLDDTISKTKEALTLWQTERGSIEIGQDSLVYPIRLDDQQKGYVFHGHCKFLLDTIVETNEGAIGKSVEREVNTPFLMLGNTEKIHQHLSIASEEDLAKMAYANKQEFVVKATNLLNRFFKKGGKSQCYSGKGHGLTFAFQDEDNGFELLLPSDGNVTYVTKSKIYILSGNRQLLMGSDEMVISKRGNLVIIKDGQILIDK